MKINDEFKIWDHQPEYGSLDQDKKYGTLTVGAYNRLTAKNKRLREALQDIKHILFKLSNPNSMELEIINLCRYALQSEGEIK